MAGELAAWTDAGLWSSSRGKTFHRRAKILAALVGMTHAELLDVLRADAEAILEARAATPRSPT
jgi:hypothetical protein